MQMREDHYGMEHDYRRVKAGLEELMRDHQKMKKEHKRMMQEHQK